MLANLDSLHRALRLHDKGVITIYSSGRIDGVKTYENDSGYLHCYIKLGGKWKWVLAHRLVWSAFNGVPNDPALEVNHMDGNKHNNRLSNLELVTQEVNMQHAYDMGLAVAPQGSEHSAAVFTEKQVTRISEMRLSGMTVKQICVKFNASQTTINRVLRGGGYRDAARAEFIPKNRITNSVAEFLKNNSEDFVSYIELANYVNNKITASPISTRNLTAYLNKNGLKLSSKPTEDDIIELRKLGMSGGDIADRLGLSKGHVFNVLKQNGLTAKKKLALTAEQKRFIFKSNLSQQAIADKLGISQASVGRIIRLR